MTKRDIHRWQRWIHLFAIGYAVLCFGFIFLSHYAASMGSSQVFLEPGETQTVETMIKCIAVASANDACVAYKYSRRSLKPLFYLPV